MDRRGSGREARRARGNLLHHARHEHPRLRPLLRRARRSDRGRLADHGPQRRGAAINWQDMRNTALLLLLTCLVLSAQRPSRPGPPASPISPLIQLLREETNPDQAVRAVQTIWETDRWFTFPKFEETAKNVAAILRRAGLEEVEIGNPPADGVTQGGYWTMPLAWDVKIGTLEILDP